MFLLVLAHSGCPGQDPESRKTVVCVYVCIWEVKAIFGMHKQNSVIQKGEFLLTTYLSWHYLAECTVQYICCNHRSTHIAKITIQE